jgi:TonB-linked SusC/RagA family outer membrane protein
MLKRKEELSLFLQIKFLERIQKKSSTPIFLILQNKSMQKILLSGQFNSDKFLSKLARYMKLIFILTFICSFHVSAKVYSQELFTLHMKNVSVDKVLNKIQKESDYRFFYNYGYLKHLSKVNISVNNEPLSGILDKLLDTSLGYRILSGNLVIISPKGIGIIQHKIEGIVTDENGMPLYGVSIQVKGTTTGVLTDASGKFSLVVDDDGVLLVSFIGYKSQEIIVGKRTSINIQLQLSAAGLNEVVVTALGISKEKKSLGYAVSTVSSKELNSTGESSMLLNLDGKVPGLVVNTSANGLDGTPRVVIRGVTSLSADNQPLYVLDGMPMLNNRSLSESLFTSSNGSSDYGNPLSDINPNDIESITVLKGASASALYGARGANGVVMITTKKGTKKGIGVTYSNNTSFQSPEILPHQQTEYGQGYDGQYSYVDGNGNGVNEQTTSLFGPRYEGQDISQWDPKTGGAIIKPWLAYGKNNLNNFFETGSNVQHYLSLSSVTDVSNIRVSLGYQNAKGIVPNTNLKRLTGTLNSNFKLGKKLTAQAVFTASNEDSKNRSFYGYGSGAMWDALFIPTNIDIRDLRNYKDSLGNKRSFYENGPNPYWDLYENANPSTRKRFSANLGLNYKINSWLSMQGHLYNDFNTLESKSISAKETYSQGSYSESLSNNQETNFEGRILINKDIKRDINLGFMLGGNLRHNKNIDKYAGTNGGILVREIYNLSNSSLPPLVSNSLSEEKVSSLFGSLDLSYKSLLYLTASARNDWSSTLPKSNWSFFYPSLSASFIFSEALHLTSDFFSYGKLRGSWARVGNATQPYSLDRFITRSSSSYNNQPVLGIQNVIPARQLDPELSKSFEVGGEFHFLNNRIKLDLSYYKNASGNQLVQVENPWDRGARFAFINAGIITNRGIEVELDFTPVKTGNFIWNVDLNFSRNRGSVSGFPEDLVDFKYIAAWNGPEIHAANGQPYGEIKGFEYYTDAQNSLANTPGMSQDFAALGYSESNIYGTGKVLTQNGMPMGNQPAWTYYGYLGMSTPYNWTGGAYNTLSYKNFELRFLLSVKSGGHIISTTIQSMQFNGGLSQSAGTNPRGGLVRDDLSSNGGYLFDGTDVQTGKPNSTYVDAQSLFSNWNFPTTDYIFSASNIKLKELSVGYNFPSSLIKRMKISNLGFSVFARNLWLIENGIPGIDTETANMGSLNNGAGLETGSLPNTRSFGCSLTIGL